MVLATRLLRSSRGGGALAPPATMPPTDASWARSASNPLLTPASAWEETSVHEPVVLHDGAWKMWYSGGWNNPGIGYATSTDGIAWTKYASNPVLGQGGSGVAGVAARPYVMRDGATYYCYYSDANPVANIKVATSTDGIAWTVQGTALASNAASWCTGWANSAVWKEGSTWHMIVEGRGATIWEITRATSTDGLTWTLVNGGARLTTLQVASGGSYGGPWQPFNGKLAGLYHLWYHAVPAAGDLPTEIYHATSPDLDTWTISPATPVLTHTGTGDEIDQVADPSVVVVNGTAYLHYAAMNNPASRGVISVATALATY